MGIQNNKIWFLFIYEGLQILPDYLYSTVLTYIIYVETILYIIHHNNTGNPSTDTVPQHSRFEGYVYSYDYITVQNYDSSLQYSRVGRGFHCTVLQYCIRYF